MDDVKVYAEAIDWLNLVLSVALVVLPTLIGLALTALFGAQAIEQGRKLWKSIRQTVDEPTDPIVAMLAAAVKLRPELVSRWILSLGDATFPEAVPLPERAALDHTAASQSSAYAAETSALESAVSAKESADSAKRAGESAQAARNG